MSLPAVASNVIERIVLMAIHDISQTQIADVVGLSEGRISQIMQSDEYRAQYSGAIAGLIEEQQILNDGWDLIETKSVSKLNDILEYNSNPDFLLKTAHIANRAQRRGGNAMKTVNGDAGARAVIHLTANFVQKIQTFVDGSSSETVENIPQKQQDFLPPDAVDKLLTPGKAIIEDLLPTFKKVTENA